MAFFLYIRINTDAMKKKIYLVSLLISATLFINCTSTKETVLISDAEKDVFEQKNGDPVVIADDESEYEITIIDPGFNAWLVSFARPEQYYSQSYLETRNRLYVTEWNQRVTQPFRFNPNLYEMQINYSANIDYGYEVNYKLYNYFIYFQRKYNQRLGHFVPRI